jgi:hypothetical protein
MDALSTPNRAIHTRRPEAREACHAGPAPIGSRIRHQSEPLCKLHHLTTAHCAFLTRLCALSTQHTVRRLRCDRVQRSDKRPAHAVRRAEPPPVSCGWCTLYVARAVRRSALIAAGGNTSVARRAARLSPQVSSALAVLLRLSVGFAVWSMPGCAYGSEPNVLRVPIALFARGGAAVDLLLKPPRRGASTPSEYAEVQSKPGGS